MLQTLVRSVPRPPLSRLLASSSLSSPPASLSASSPSPELDPLTALAQQFKSLPTPPSVTFLLGGPGSGKGTLASNIVSHKSHRHVSVGALLREASQSDTSEGRDIARVISSGTFVTAYTCTRILLRSLCENHNNPNPVIVDGFPRTIGNALLWQSLGLRPNNVIALEVGEEEMRQRLLGRGRSDDQPHVIERRLSEFKLEWPQIKQFYIDRGLLTTVDGSGKADQVWDRFAQAPAETI